ncbi:hypothetical protein GTO91_15870 [Heliobacterium undosum]|uniref:Exo-alpha-sialidase n=1 Tax=Heliomicrobium undosum TaxID=121734 RepID=A0A845L823_9FIRM|nr:hypothetical protein [Heliomicrobium undosum]MZP31185.1 hypothetical protein [Heliomicrobium undosum]
MFDYQEVSRVYPDTDCVESTVTTLKVSIDGGQTWHKIFVDLSADIEQSGLKPGYLILHQGERYRVAACDDGRLILVRESSGRKHRSAIQL